MATTHKPAPQPAPVPQQQGQETPNGQMTGTSGQTPQQGQPIFRDWASI